MCSPAPLNDSQYIPRCPECILIPEIILKYEKKECNIEYYCENGHHKIISISDFQEKSKKNSIDKLPCIECNKNKIENNEIEFIF